LIEVAPGSSDNREKLVETAVGTGMGVLEFGAEKLSLEEIFLQLTTREEGMQS
jgi:hypothetical protein